MSPHSYSRRWVYLDWAAPQRGSPAWWIVLFAVLCLTPVQALAQTLQIWDGGQPRLFEQAPAKPIISQSAGASGNDIYLDDTAKIKLPENRRRLTRTILVRLNPGADPAAVARTVGADSVKPALASEPLFLFQASAVSQVFAMVEKLRKLSGVASADPILARQQTRKFAPTDPLFAAQWHFHNRGEQGAMAGVDLNLTKTWDTYRGKGIVIGIVDDGLDLTHPDLAQHINSSLGYDWNGGDSDPSANPARGDFHGTLCAGAAAAVGNNGEGIAGVAFESTLAGLRLIAGESTDETEAASILFKNQDIHIKSNSWGPSDDGKTLEGPGPLALAALAESIRSGRRGKGTIFVWPGGNGFDTGDNANYDGYANSIYTIAVTGVSDQGWQPDYGEPGACLIAALPSGSIDRSMVLTTDLQGSAGVNRAVSPGDVPDLNYTRTFTGTSAAVALASGSIALILQANPELGWRDVQEVLIRSASKVDDRDPDWKENAAGIHFNHKYGAGLLNVDAAVALALRWPNLSAQKKLSVPQTNLDRAIPDQDPLGLTFTFDLSESSLRVEHVTLTASVAHPFRGNLAITLVSPSGMESRLAEKHLDSGADYVDWTFMSVRHWAERSQGVWKVKIADLEPGSAGVVNSLRLDVYGTETGQTNRSIVELTTFSDTARGNGNGAVEPGETIFETVSFKNLLSPSLAGSVRLISRTPGVTVLQGKSALSGNDLSLYVSNQVPFSYRLSEGVPCHTTLLFDVVTEAAPFAWTNTILHEAGSPPAKWLVQTVDSEKAVGSHTSIALEANGLAHISYYDITRVALKHAWQTNSSWNTETVDHAGDVGTFNSLALDGNGRPHISYRDATMKRLKYAAWNGSRWDIETITTPGNAGSFSSLALDKQNAPHIAFQDESQGRLLYATKVGGEWVLQTVDPSAGTGANVSLALDAGGKPRISYRDVTLRALKFAEWDGTLWRTETVDNAGSVGFDTSLKIGSDGQPRISYRDTTNADLKFARRTSNGWRIEVVESAGSVGFNTSLALDKQDRPRISYWDIGNTDLKFAAWSGTSWEIQAVDVDGSVGSYSSVALDAFDHPRISYRDVTQGALKFASLDQVECVVFHSSDRPELRITSSPDGIVLSWPSAFPDFVLETSPALANDANWTSSAAIITQEGASLKAKLPLEPRGRFYRLRQLPE